MFCVGGRVVEVVCVGRKVGGGESCFATQYCFADYGGR